MDFKQTDWTSGRTSSPWAAVTSGVITSVWNMSDIIALILYFLLCYKWIKDGWGTLQHYHWKAKADMKIDQTQAQHTMHTDTFWHKDTDVKSLCVCGNPIFPSVYVFWSCSIKVMSSMLQVEFLMFVKSLTVGGRLKPACVSCFKLFRRCVSLLLRPSGAFLRFRK